MDNYRQLERYSNSDLSEFKQILISGKWKRPEKVFAFGSSFHELVLEPEKANLAIHDEKETESLKGMLKSSLENEYLQSVLKLCKNQIEQVYIFESQGMPCKAKLDLVHPNGSMVYDLKTTSSRSLDEFYKSCIKFDYFRQGAFYADAIGAYGATFIGVSKFAPYDIFVVTLSDDDLTKGREDYMILLKMIKETNYKPSAWVAGTVLVEQ